MKPILFLATFAIILASCRSMTKTGLCQESAVSSCSLTTILDEGDRKNLEAQSPQTIIKIERDQQLTLDDIKAMSQVGMRDGAIIEAIKKTGSLYDLSTANIIELKNARVPPKVIDYLVNGT